MRHAQYLVELTDLIKPFVGPLPLFISTRDGQASIPSVLTRWTGSRLDKTAGGWKHSFSIEILAAELGSELELITHGIAEAVADWKPNTSAAHSDPPAVVPSTTTTGEATYPTVVITTAANEPRN